MADFLDAQYGEFLAMPPFAPVVLSALFLENEDFSSARLLDNLRANGRIRHGRPADSVRVTVADGEHFRQRDFSADVAGDSFDHDLVAGTDAVLLSASFYDRKH